MPGGKGNIRPEDNTNGFDKRPEDAGYPKGKPNQLTILKQAMKAKFAGKSDTELDPLYFFAWEMLDLIKNKNVKDADKVKALTKLIDRFYGMPSQPIETTGINPVIQITPDAKEDHNKMKDM